MIGTGGIGAGWLCFPVGAACAVGVIHVAPSIMARYAAVYGAPHCTREVHCVIPPAEFRPGGLFYHGGLPLSGMSAPGFGYGGFGAGSPFASGGGFGGASGGGSNRERHHHHETPVALVDTAQDVGAPLVVSAPLSPPLIDTTPFAPPTLGTGAYVPTVPPAEVPEPGTWGVLVVAMLGLFAIRRRI